MVTTDTPVRTGYILVDHGSKKGAANDMLDAMAGLFQQVSGFEIVEPAHMELAEPSIAQAFERCVAKGARRVFVHPYFLSPGRHSTSDIPRLVAEAAMSFPGVGFHVTPPLGLDEKIARLILERVEECQANQFACENCQGALGRGTAANKT